METLSQCPLCAADLLKPRASINIDGWRIMTCAGCGVGLTNPRPTLDEIGKYYRPSFFSYRPDAQLLPTCRQFLRREMGAADFVRIAKAIVLNEIKYRHDQTLQGRGMRRALLAPLRWLLALCYEPIQSLPAEPGVALDIGFGRGEFLYRAKRLGWECHGLEVSPTSVQWGQELGFFARQFDGSFSERLDYPDESFDLISLNNVLEHVHHPRFVVEECHRLLKPGGRIFIMVPNFECRDKDYLHGHWRMWSPPQHLFHFTAENVETLLREHEFAKIKVRYKKWFNPITEKLSLKSIRPTVNRSEYRKIVWRLRVGKRLEYVLGLRSAAEIAPGMAVEAIKS